MERMFSSRSDRFAVEVEIEQSQQKVSQDPSSSSSLSSSSVEEISLKFTIQTRSSIFHQAEDGVSTLIRQEDGAKIPFARHQLSVNIFNHGDDTLHRYLSSHLARYGDAVDPKATGDEIIKKWVQIREEGNSSAFGKVFSLTVNLILWDIVTMPYRSSPSTTITRPYEMVPAKNSAIEEMLKKVEEMEVQSCVICWEDLGKEERIVLQMPCLHVFHGECIEKWLKISHYCPICRFQMPTN